MYYINMNIAFQLLENIDYWSLIMPTIHEHRCLNCGSHGHGRAACPHPLSPREEKPALAPTNKGEQNNISTTEKTDDQYGKEQVDLEIKAEESLMNY
jgi:hypothetical protein